MNIKRVLWLILGVLIISLSFNIFFLPYGIVSGGAGGIALIFNKLFSLKIEITIILISVMFWILGLIFLEKKEIFFSIFSLLLFPLFIYLTGLLLKNINLTIDSKIVSALIGGTTFGFGLGLIYKEGFYIGGIDILAKIIYEITHLNFTVVIFILDIIIVLISAFTFDFETMIYSFVSICFCRMMIDKVILGINNNKSFYIITKKPQLVKKLVVQDLGHGATILRGKGAYTNEKKYILFVSIPSRDYYKLRDGLKQIDCDAFFVTSNSYEVSGGK